MGNTEVAIAILAIVGIIAAALSIISYVAYLRTQNRAVLFLVGAFVVFTIKNLFAAASLSANIVAHEHLEVIEGLFDLVVVALLIAPFFSR